MDPLLLILINSFQASTLLFFVPETAWFAARDFGHMAMLPVSLAAVIGSTFGVLINWLVGHVLKRKRNDWFQFPDRLYDRAVRVNRYAQFLLLLSLATVPGLGVLFALFAITTSLLGTSFRRAVLLIFCGRCLYYLFMFYWI